ncbi:hypothetical protein MED121_16639 [Marinomonas sp. MED121]|nr:hypothetical protein MED121_16639 [Marinomonas sp. MED121]
MINRILPLKRLLTFLLLFNASYSYSIANQAVVAPFMWQIKTEKANLYLVGSIHALNETFYPLAPAYLDAFDSVNKLVVELNILALNPIDAQKHIAALTWLDEDETLANLFNDKEISQLQPFAERKGMDMQTFLRLRPWLILEMISSYQFAQTDFQTALGVDQFFIKRAQQKAKTVLELETLEEQINAINGASLSAQTAAISLALSQLDQGQEQLTQMATLWQSADAKGLDEYSQKDLIEQPNIAPLMSQLLYKRNQVMASRIQTYLETGGSYFVVVGALHLSGSQSVQSHLKKVGYEMVKVLP